MSKQRQPEGFKLEIDADETDSHGSPQGRLAFSIPFVESRSMKLQSLECDARSKRACESFEDTFAEGQPEDEDDSSAD
jgi:hypothetical protein